MKICSFKISQVQQNMKVDKVLLDVSNVLFNSSQNLGNVKLE